MRLASGLFACALSLSLGFLACTRFSGTDDPGSETEAGTDTGTDTPSFDAGGFVVVEGQTSATELVANDDIVVWSFASGVSAANPATANASTTLVTTRSAVSLQLLDDHVYFASGDTVYYTATDGGMLESGARSITPQGTDVPVRAQYVFATAISYATAAQLEWCSGAACGTAAPKTVDLGNAGVGAMRSDPGGQNLWLGTANDLRSYDTASMSAVATIDVDGGVGAFIIDTLSAYYTPTAGGVILAKDLTANDPAKTLATVDGHPFAFALDSGSLYVAVFEKGTVLKVNKTTGAITTIATGLTEPRSLGLSGGRLLVLTDGKIISYDKGP